jgi:hypothetical protein
LVKIAPAPTASLQAPTVSGNTVNVSPIVKWDEETYEKKLYIIKIV